jgi:hypothetical protein
MMNVLPTVSDRTDGCQVCAQTPLPDEPIDESIGVVRWYQDDTGTARYYRSNYYCSGDCFDTILDKIEKYIPQDPDLVRVGGRVLPETKLQDCSFLHAADQMEVTVPVPGGFTGVSKTDESEYNYLGEPVHVKNEGDWIQSGIIKDVLHEDHQTTLVLESKFHIEQLTHPESRVREEHRQNAPSDVELDCETCGKTLIQSPSDKYETCPFCEHQL